jgi:hypothetical protein
MANPTSTVHSISDSMLKGSQLPDSGFMLPTYPPKFPDVTFPGTSPKFPPPSCPPVPMPDPSLPTWPPKECPGPRFPPTYPCQPPVTFPGPDMPGIPGNSGTFPGVILY